MKPHWSRRKWLLGTAGVLGSAVWARQGDPAQSDITPSDQFFVRNHFKEPDASLATWKLRIDGRVRSPSELTFSDLLEQPTVEQTSVLECAGNGVSGGAVSMGLWQGISLSALLQSAGADPAGDVLLEGADSGQLLRDAPGTPYIRIVPGQKCWAPESLLAFKLNGRFLPKHNGFPARAIFPGWYGMDSVKWIRRISILAPGEKPSSYDRAGMSELYSRLRSGLSPDRITSILVKSSINYPPDKSKLLAALHNVSGYAWTGSGVVKSVAISTDAGRNWDRARLETSPRPFSWVRWTYPWQANPGEHLISSRAEDSSGNQQPLTRDVTRLDSYEMNWCAPIRCIVR